MQAQPNLLDQLNTLSDSLRTTNHLINRLSRLTFQPGTERLDSANSVRIELAQDIHDSLKQLEEDLELLSQEAEDLNSTSIPHRRRDSEADRTSARLSAQINRLNEDLKTSRSQFRRAQLTAKKAAESAKQKERELLFASRQNPPPDPASTSDQQADLFSARRRGPGNQKQLTREELETDASSNVTAALRRTHDLLSTELSRSRFAQETFDQSTAALADLGERYTDLGSILGKSRELLSTLLRSQKSDTWYLETAFYILLATFAWLFFRRILWGPFYLLPRFFWRWFVWPILGPVFSIIGLRGGSTAAVSGGTIVSTSTRPSLIVQPSATRGNRPTFPAGMSAGLRVPAGGGGAGARMDHQKLQGEVSEGIGKMAEESERQAQGGQEVRRADGTVLEERGDKPRNPKKKMFEADVEDAKMEEQRRTEQEAECGRKRDEL